jgi:hypothetical protein
MCQGGKVLKRELENAQCPQTCPAQGEPHNSAAPSCVKPGARHHQLEPSNLAIELELSDKGPGNLWERGGGRESIKTPGSVGTWTHTCGLGASGISNEL